MTQTNDTNSIRTDLQYFASILEAEKSSIKGAATKNSLVADTSTLINNQLPGVLISLGERIAKAETESQRSVHRSVLPLVTGELNSCKTRLGYLDDRLKRLPEENDLHSPGLGDEIRNMQNSVARLSAQIKIIQQVIQSETGKAVSLQDEVRINAQQLAGNRNMHLLEQGENGLSHSWTGPASTTLFQIPIARKIACEIRIRCITIIKPEYAKDLTILVEGSPVKHRRWYDGSHFNLICKLPPADMMRPTELGICLPATFSPKELGISEDERKLGIAINEIQAGKPGNLVLRMLRHLRLKK